MQHHDASVCELKVLYLRSGAHARPCLQSIEAVQTQRASLFGAAPRFCIARSRRIETPLGNTFRSWANYLGRLLDEGTVDEVALDESEAKATCCEARGFGDRLLKSRLKLHHLPAFAFGVLEGLDVCLSCVCVCVCVCVCEGVCVCVCECVWGRVWVGMSRFVCESECACERVSREW